MFNVTDEQVVAAACAAGIMAKANEMADQALAFQKMGLIEVSKHAVELMMKIKAEAEKYEVVALSAFDN